MYYNYVMLSEIDKKFYVGFTNTLERRLSEQNNGMVSSTAKRRPLFLIYFEACLNKADAVKREKYLKSGFGRRFLNNRLENYLNENS